MTVQQRKAIFGLSKGLKMNDEELHTLVFGLTECESLTMLDDIKAETVLRELRERMRYGNRTEPLENRKPKKEQPEAVPGMMTSEQQSLAWRLMYRLQELDTSPRAAVVGERMTGAILKILGITTKPGRDIFKWVSFEDGAKLIEGLKRYVRSAERKAQKGA